MSCNILANADDTLACFFCDITDVAFGPVVHGSAEWGAKGRMAAFRLSLDVDPRSMSLAHLMDEFAKWQPRKDSRAC